MTTFIQTTFPRHRQLKCVKSLIRLPTESNKDTSEMQQFMVEDSCFKVMKEFHDVQIKGDLDVPVLNREGTLRYLYRGLLKLSSDHACLDASRPWLIYWIIHSLELLGETLSEEKKIRTISFLAKCQNESGGFGGGPDQLSHLAPTYAAVNTIAILKDKRGFEMINRHALSKWLFSLKLEDGSFLMHKDGEVDIRGVYCAVSIAKLTKIFSEKLFTNTFTWVLKCQTYEGGFGATPGNEAHGGYTFCGLATLAFLKKEHSCHVKKLLRWTASRQMKVEGGFQGRTNKLVDSCYSFWQGGVFPLLHNLLAEEGHGNSLPTDRWLFDQEALQEYLLVCCQDRRGGLFDKPEKPRDFYHTSYALSGLSLAQNFNWLGAQTSRNARVLGAKSNHVVETSPLFNIGMNAVSAADAHFKDLETDEQ